ncbi:UDP-N-acetylmuramoyl-tripeptide--D-alanyl-D-alanine ligase [Flavicella sp.]|uniref:UDP-N-acetylmuramoyl-tripeptide--D-alanyl-D- alanine ligase n=1 Tax=Flavicella sp. TaxID=2957742 RepID=UPI0030190564
MRISTIYKYFKQSNGVITDTRNITNNTIFFALKGENFNGNKFAEKALKSGAIYAIIDEPEFDTSDKTILVKDVLKTLQKLANYHRRELNTKIISLTGSNGKTTTKELIHVVLSKKFNTTATAGNLNNHIGVPLTLLSFTEKTEIGIVEMGANHLHEIELLTSITEPDFGYITNFGKAHLEGFGSLEGVIKGKTELFDYLKANNRKVFINSKDPIQVKLTTNLDSIYFGDKTNLLKTDPFLVIEYAGLEIHTHLIGKYNFSNLNAAIAIGEYFNVSATDIKLAIESYRPTNNRSQIIEKGKSKIILDAYNANPTSMEAALNNFKQISATKKIIILGDMFELGKTSNQEHQAILNLAESLCPNEIHLIGKHFSKTKASKSNLHSTFEAFKKSFHPTSATYLIKGSRGMALERTLELFD